MSDLYWRTDEQMTRLAPYFPKSHGKPRVDDRRVVSGIVYVIKHGLEWKDAPREYGPHKTLYNRWKQWGEMGVFVRMMEGLSAQRVEPIYRLLPITPSTCYDAIVRRTDVDRLSALAGATSP